MTWHRSPGDAPRGLLSFPPSAGRGGVAHTPGMRQWASLVALLLGLSGSGYVWSARPRPAVPIERRLTEADLPGVTRRTLRWWLP